MALRENIVSQNQFLTSRSAIEAYQTCRYKWYLQYAHGGKGIVPMSSSIPLTTGTAVHEGIGYLLRHWLNKGPESALKWLANGALVDNAVKVAIKWHEDSVKSVQGQDVVTTEQEEFVIGEQRALIEVLVRIWSEVEYPALLRHYNILYTEQEMAMSLTKNHVLMARVDAILELDGNLVSYNIKTAKEWTERSTNNFNIDLQGLTEAAVTEHLLERPVKSVRYCVLVKGRRSTEKRPGGFRYTVNPFIRGYYKRTLDGTYFAHSYEYPNPENEGGYSRLGKGWEPFYVWQHGSVSKWMKSILDGKVQEVIDPQLLLRQHCITPADKFRSKKDVDLAIEQVKLLAIEQSVKLEHPSEDDMRLVFVQNRRACLWPEPCEYYPICHGKSGWTFEPVNIGDDYIASGLYQVRTPHHEMERESEG